MSTPHGSPGRRRRSIRLRDYDYSRPGAYFVTMCTHRRAPCLGDVRGHVMRPNAFGRCVILAWNDLPRHYSHVGLDAAIVMPDHFHGIVLLTDRGPPGLPEIVRALKAFSARQINALGGTQGTPVWQRNYYERVIRNDDALQRIRRYIELNPARWTGSHRRW